ncbi:MAG: PD-(D/E)XK nuclease family protein, partial [Gammaproteobacteria bacterium]|nr:PD-(D/E)XK nuclease family protein [Gammaproteobacteria bacterium]
RHEQARLLYVACTRARQTLNLIGHINLTADAEEYRPPVRSSLLHLLWPAVEPQYATAFAEFVTDSGGDGGGDSRDVWVQPVLRRFESQWQLPAVANIPGTAVDADVGAADAEVEFYWVGTEARIAGTIVHRWLHAFAEQRAELNPESLTRYRSVTRRWLKEMGVADTMIADIGERVELALRNTLSDEQGKWVVRGEGHAELALSGVYEGKVESVILDRVRVDRDGVHWIVDYKTSSHEGGDLAGFLQAETERYTPQLRKYAAIYSAFAGNEARCALYFPLLQTFLEVDVQA